MEVINGTDIIIVVETSSGNYKPVAGANSFSLTVTRTIRDTTHKHSGPAAKSDYGRYNWNVTINGLKSYYTDFVNYDWFLSKQLSKSKVKIIAAPLDYQTAGTTPLSQSTEIEIIDSDDSGTIDSDTVNIQSAGDVLALNSIITTITPKANYGQAVIESIEQTGGDNDNPTFTVALKGDKQIQTMATVAESGASFSPLSVFDTLWIDSDMDITISTGVSLWEDQSVAGNDLSQGTGSLQPGVNDPDSDFGGQPSVDADGTDDWLDFASALALNDFSIIIVFRYAGYILGNDASSVHYWEHGATAETLRISTTSTFTGLSADATVNCVEFHRTGSSINCFKNGEASTSNPLTNATVTNFNALFRRTTSYSGAKIAAMYVNSSEISAGDKVLMETYLNDRFGIIFS